MHIYICVYIYTYRYVQDFRDWSWREQIVQAWTTITRVLWILKNIRAIRSIRRTILQAIANRAPVSPVPPTIRLYSLYMTEHRVTLYLLSWSTLLTLSTRSSLSVSLQTCLLCCCCFISLIDVFFFLLFLICGRVSSSICSNLNRIGQLVSSCSSSSYVDSFVSRFCSDWNA